jgi:acetoin utilization deacetylase AcuC-like enzyme
LTARKPIQVHLVDDPLFDEHRARGYHPERPERLLAARQAVLACEARGIVFRGLSPRDATAGEIALVHAPAYIDALEQSAGLFSALDDDTYLAPRSVAAAYRAAGGALALVDALLCGAGATTGVALLRPPGHHARRDRGMGFCLVNNIAVAAAHARRAGARKVAIVDWDVHHGNGTQDAFYADPSVLFISLHQAPFYPGTGLAEETGEGEGRGYNLNVPLSAGAGDAAYAAAFDRIVLPVLDAYAPDLVLVSAGFDAHVRDPLAGMSVSAGGFGAMARGVSRAAARSAGGRIGFLLEGGYDLDGLEASLAETILAAVEPEAAQGSSSARAEAAPPSARHGLDLERAARAARQFWKV